MEIVAKLLILGPRSEHLLMYRSNHPAYGDDPDLPGGIIEKDESVDEGLVREVEEEAGVTIDPTHIQRVYAGSEYSESNMQYILYTLQLQSRPAITLSWEHASYEWVDKQKFLDKANTSNDSYMRMVGDVLGSTVRSR